MLPGEVQGDAAFVRFQSKLATVVASARAIGKKIGSAGGCCCPLGAHPEALTPFPPSVTAQKAGWAEVSGADLVCFIGGYAHGFVHGSGPYQELGCAYREMFP